MRLISLLAILSILSSPLLVAASSRRSNNANSTITAFNISAISAVNGTSVLQCWQITLPLGVSSTAGIQGAAVQQLGDVSNLTWGSLPAGYPGIAHPAPTVLYVNPHLPYLSYPPFPFPFSPADDYILTKINRYNIFLSGTLRITIPNSPQEVIVHGGKHGFLLAADIASVSKLGHVSSVVGDEELTGLMIPTLNAAIPPHKVIREDPCTKDDMDY